MSDIAALIADMVRAGVDPELIGRTAATIAGAQAPAPKTARQERNARYYQKKASERRLNSDDQDVSDDQDAPSSPEVSPHTPLPNPSNPIPPSPPKGGSSPTARVELETVLDADRAQAVLDHRQRIRKPLTAHAAKLLAGKFRRCPDPNSAADAMIANGWQGFEPEWLESRTATRATAPPQHRERSVSDVLGEIAAGTWQGPQGQNDEPDYLTIDASFSSRN